ncbi:hypothetical protein RhiirB3_435475 [Rhizophagus irregularis]|nr:hypothetical protein RhiirB3_435475 [Rhizophagus irregularis]
MKFPIHIGKILYKEKNLPELYFKQPMINNINRPTYFTSPVMTTHPEKIQPRLQLHIRRRVTYVARIILSLLLPGISLFPCSGSCFYYIVLLLHIIDDRNLF